MFELLFEHDVDLNIIIITFDARENDKLITLLQEVIYNNFDNIIRFLISKNVDLIFDRNDFKFKFVFHVIFFANQIDNVKMLIEFKSDCNAAVSATSQRYRTFFMSSFNVSVLT